MPLLESYRSVVQWTSTLVDRSSSSNRGPTVRSPDPGGTGSAQRSMKWRNSDSIAGVNPSRICITMACSIARRMSGGKCRPARSVVSNSCARCSKPLILGSRNVCRVGTPGESRRRLGRAGATIGTTAALDCPPRQDRASERTRGSFAGPARPRNERRGQ
ncbi:hypothetical protein Mpe_A2855 [Methylibium petroleiphilum PM1]|uniref:Uncharacterized protein n=1 Tax=Methylibium petroleiphilum (strain ATCC BAA-1232 / LMG 22953 / PM1) TaxID=420662 RepID=A2SJS0_METPP|nr:hypothetical protein Mpe_A2855 [Methylibium petroleiphilum PM1]